MRIRQELTPLRVVMLTILAVALMLAIFGPVIWDGAAEETHLDALSGGSTAANPLGTDALGRDMLARTLVATRLSLLLAIAVATLGFLAGILLGALPSLGGPRMRRRAGAVINLLIAFPSLLLALLVVTMVGIGTQGAVLALAVAGTPQIARLTQTLAAKVVGSDYVTAARATGISRWRLMVRHVLPNIAPPLALQYAGSIGTALLSLSALSFLGVGVQEPSYDWGSLLAVALDRVYLTPVAVLGPAAAIVLVSLAFNVLGDALADILSVDPASRRSGRHRVPSPSLTASPAGDQVETAAPTDAILAVDRLSVSFRTDRDQVTPVRDVSLNVRHGERLGIVGESGSGKSLTALAVAQLIERPGVVNARSITFEDADLASLDKPERDRRLATSMAMVFQDPLSSFNPALRIGRQVTESSEVHLGRSRAEATAIATARFGELAIAGGERRLGQYPHELSGGMRQRAMIAMGLMTQPRLILADEPTTALDVTVQRQVLYALHQANAEHGTAIVLISHDISVVEAFCERVVVMYAGRVVEEVAADRLRDGAAHPYTRALLAAVPDMTTDRDARLASIPGRPPAAGEVVSGCAFAPRCGFATDRCRTDLPPSVQQSDGHRIACWHPRPVAAVT
nr:dipeptide/oligopeptide/nickel ABC transporter permease/ATP-binding protein [Patulibacter sp.]